jgi:hypothetical protein
VAVVKAEVGEWEGCEELEGSRMEGTAVGRKPGYVLRSLGNVLFCYRARHKSMLVDGSRRLFRFNWLHYIKISILDDKYQIIRVSIKIKSTTTLSPLSNIIISNSLSHP